jgi:hypothetical protein
MSRFRLPAFVAPISIWRSSNWGGTVPPTGPADVLSVANLTPGRRVFEESIGPVSYILIPKETDIRFSEGFSWTTWPASDPDLVEVPTGSGLYYTVGDVERVALGFANEHLEAAIVKASPWGGTPPITMALVATAIQFASTPSGGSLAPAFSATPSAGDFLMCAVVTDATSVPTVFDSVNGSWTLVTSVAFGASSTLYLFYLPDTLAGVGGYDVNNAGTSGISCLGFAFSGVSTLFVPDSVQSGTWSGTSVTAGPTVATGLDLQIAIAATPEHIVTWGTVPSGWTLGNNINPGTAKYPGIALYFKLSDSGAYSPVIAITPTVASGGWITAAFKP